MDKQEIIARISNATPLGLLLISYDLFLDATATAKESVKSQKTTQEGASTVQEGANTAQEGASTDQEGVSTDQEGVNTVLQEASDLERDLEYMQKILTEIINSLDLEQELSHEILPIYMYVNKLIIECIIKANRKNQEKLIITNLTTIETIMKTLLEGLESLEDTDEPINPGSQQIIAGLTYQKDGRLNEFIDESSGRNFEA